MRFKIVDCVDGGGPAVGGWLGVLDCGSFVSFVGSIVARVCLCVRDACACLGCGLKFKFRLQMGMVFLRVPLLCAPHSMCVCMHIILWLASQKCSGMIANESVCVCELCKNILKLRRRRLSSKNLSSYPLSTSYVPPRPTLPIHQRPPPTHSPLPLWQHCRLISLFVLPLAPVSSRLSHFICHSCMHTCAPPSHIHPPDASSESPLGVSFFRACHPPGEFTWSCFFKMKDFQASWFLWFVFRLLLCMYFAKSIMDIYGDKYIITELTK